MNFHRLDGLRVSHRLSILFFFVVAGFIAITALLLISLRLSLVEDHRNRVKHLAESATGVVAYYRTLEQNKQMTREQAQAAAKDALRGVRYGGSDYYFIYDFDGNAVMVAAKPEMEGKNFLGKTDAVGTKLWDLFVESGKKGGGFVEYWFPRAGSTAPLPKLAYVSGFADWRWIVGTGVYVDDVDAIFKRKVAEAALVFALALALVLGAGFLIVRSVLRQLGGEPAYAAELMKKAAAGDLSVTVHASSSDSLLGSLDAMLCSLRAMVHDIAAASQAVAQESQRIVTESADVVQTTSRQSDATTAMAAAMEELTVSINHISESARETQNNSSHAADLASDGEQRTEASAAAIRCISETVSGATDRIRQLVARFADIGSAATVIKDISSQTNLLALNAAIEAARAGEQGRGFAVVADEVRALAERTAEATVRIEQMIDSIQTDSAEAVLAMDTAAPQVQRGVALSESVAEALRGIREGAGATLGLVSEVADATREQSVASNSLASQVEQVAQMVERTSASTRQTADAAGRLKTCSDELHGLVGRFRC